MSNSNGTAVNEIAIASPAEAPAPVTPGFDSIAGFEALQRIARVFSISSLVPQQFQGDRNFGNAIIALDMALRMRANPLMVYQNLYVVSGKPAWSSPFLIATFNKSGRFSALRYQFEGKPGTDDWGCRAVATELSTGEALVGTLVTIGIAKTEGWFGKGGSKWKTMPEQMLRYRAASWFIRAFAPEIAMGLYSEDELRDSMPAVEGGVPGRMATADDINSALSGGARPKGRGRRAGARQESGTAVPAEGAAPDASDADTEGAAVPATGDDEGADPSAVSAEPASSKEEKRAKTEAARLSREFTLLCEREQLSRGGMLSAYCNLYPEASIEEAIAHLMEDRDEFVRIASLSLEV